MSRRSRQNASIAADLRPAAVRAARPAAGCSAAIASSTARTVRTRRRPGCRPTRRSGSGRRQPALPEVAARRIISARTDVYSRSARSRTSAGRQVDPQRVAQLGGEQLGAEAALAVRGRQDDVAQDAPRTSAIACFAVAAARAAGAGAPGSRHRPAPPRRPRAPRRPARRSRRAGGCAISVWNFETGRSPVPTSSLASGRDDRGHPLEASGDRGEPRRQRRELAGQEREDAGAQEVDPDERVPALVEQLGVAESERLERAEEHVLVGDVVGRSGGLGGEARDPAIGEGERAARPAELTSGQRSSNRWSPTPVAVTGSRRKYSSKNDPTASEKALMGGGYRAAARDVDAMRSAMMGGRRAHGARTIARSHRRRDPRRARLPRPCPDQRGGPDHHRQGAPGPDPPQVRTGRGRLAEDRRPGARVRAREQLHEADPQGAVVPDQPHDLRPVAFVINAALLLLLAWIDDATIKAGSISRCIARVRCADTIVAAIIGVFSRPASLDLLGFVNVGRKVVGLR